MGTDGFEFVEFCHPHPEELDRLFKVMSFVAVSKAPFEKRHTLPSG
jgi:4-hydroxyphenylpyruvate dioxygenase